MLINILSHQNNSGKTTLALNIATKLSAEGYQVLLVTDNNNTNLMNWLDKLSQQASSLTVKTSPLDSLANHNDDYDFVLLDTNTDMQLSSDKTINLICLDFTHLDTDYISTMDYLLTNSYIVPCKVPFNEGKTLKLLDQLVSYAGIEQVLDGIPKCERIHDLPLIGKTIWELDNKPLQAAFTSIANSLITYLQS